jgi:hypothetical protein
MTMLFTTGMHQRSKQEIFKLLLRVRMTKFAFFRKTNQRVLRKSVIASYSLLVVSSYEKDNLMFSLGTDCNRFIIRGRNNQCL